MNNTTFKSLSDLSKGIKEKIELIDSGKYGLKELENALLELNELQERLIVLKYKAIEQLATSVNFSSDEKTFAPEIPPIVEPSVQSNQMTIMDGIKEVSKESISVEISKKEVVSENKLEGQTSLAEQMESSSISDIRAAMGINQKFSFRKNLFSDNSDAFEAALEKIEKSNSLQDALKIVNEIRNEHAWDIEDEVVLEFEELLNRRFSA